MASLCESVWLVKKAFMMFMCNSDSCRMYWQLNIRSPQKNSAFQKLFGLPHEEFLLKEYTCYLKRKLPVQVCVCLLFFRLIHKLVFYLGKLHLQIYVDWSENTVKMHLNRMETDIRICFHRASSFCLLELWRSTQMYLDTRQSFISSGKILMTSKCFPQLLLH